nr:hypothetical protein [Tanacetum cinerariifolium]
MTLFNQRECVGCGQPCDGFYCYLCACQQCGVNLINGICLNCTYGDGNPVTCCECEGPLNDGFCSFYASRAGNSFAYDPNLNSFDDSQNLSDYPPQPQYQMYSCELCRNDAHYGYDCPPQVSYRYCKYHKKTEKTGKNEHENRKMLRTLPIPSESESISDDTCDVPFCDNSPPVDVLNDHFELFSDFNDDCTSSDDDSFEDINYVEASPPDSELFGLEEVKDDILREKLLNINLLNAKIESLNVNPTPDCVLNDHTKETSSGSTTTHADNSLPEYDSFLFEIEPDQGQLISVVMEDILGEPHVHVPNVLPTHTTLMLDSDFIPSDDSLGSDLKVSFPFGIRNKIFDPGIYFEVQSKRFLSRDTFSISFICNLLCLVSETLLPFSSENENKVFNPGTDVANITRKRPKPDKNEHENGKTLLLADERFSKIKQAFREEQHQLENIQELLRKLLNDLQILNEILLERGEHAAQISTPYWKFPVFYDDDDDDE